ncbi:sigma-54-dependent Fis family transcriptional regulator [Hydrogenophaga sp. 5NK40-0174]|uniref:sigma-54-dependent Fis family transcriptional regulator n=1 Tax=Hydrogenophaga sp. 5NK40-0174 TaxID=3127649 RepID=UPI003342D11C
MGQANQGGPLGAANEDHTHLIDASRERSASYGLSESDAPDFSSPRKGDLSDALDENRFLFQHAAPVMETLYDQIANTHSMVLLTSSRGMVLHSLGDADFLERASQVALTPGMDWSEQSKGTNAIGTALSEEEALTVHGNQHFMNVNKFLTCSCSPIFDPYGQVIGALDVTGDHRSFHQHTLALVRMSAQMIENHMFADIFPKAIRIHFHTRAEFLGTLVEGIAVFSPEGRFISANRSAQFQLGLPFSALKAHTFSSLFGIPVSSLLELFHGATTAPRQLVLHNGVSVWCRASHKAPTAWTVPQGSEGIVVSSAAKATDAAAQPETASVPGDEAPYKGESGGAAAAARKPALSSLRYLNTGDPQVASVIHKLGKVSGRDIPIMILGETGTGKDLLAQAIHGDSNRSTQPFVSVNCASIPETLIESELFGYEEGAFTGARKKGAIGKVQQANGGTLFLDEIGDMPKHLQARLLRVLQERKVSPLGAGKEVDVDVAIICATHKNLKDMIAKGEFREDLYYRLNGLVVKLPALRDRTDFEPVVKRILKTLAETEQTITLSPAVLDLFKRYHWPGNFRQLHNLLRTAVVMVGDDGVVHMDHLPDDFLEEIGQSPMGCSPALSDASLAAQASPLSATFGHGASPQGSHTMNSASMAGSGRNLQDVAITAMADMLRMHKGNVSAAAKALGVSRNTIYRKRHLLPPDVFN